MPHLDAPAPPTPPRAPETFSESQYPGPKGLIVDPIPIQKQLMRMLAAIIALAIIAQLILWGLAFLNHRWTQSGPKSGAARWAASQVFAGEKVGGTAGLIAKFKNQTPAPGTPGGYFLAKVAEGSLASLAKTGNEDPGFLVLWRRQLL